MRDFGLDYNIFLTGYSDPATFESEGRLQIDGGGNEGVVAKIIKIIIAISKQSGSISARFSEPDESDSAVEEIIEIEA